MSAKALCLFAGVMLAGFCSAAQLLAQAPPAVDRPKDFSHVVGSYRISYTAQPADVQVEDPITMKVRITGKGPKEYQPKRRDLHLFKQEVGEQFYIEPVADEDRVLPGKNGESTWEFVYRLRPKSTSVKEVPEPRLIFYDPRRSFQTIYPDDDPIIALTVRPRHVPPDILGPGVVTAPERLYHLATGDAVLAQEDVQPYWTTSILIGVLLGAPLVSTAAFVLYRRLCPDHTRRQQQRRSLAARRAVRELGRNRPCPCERMAKILTGYLGQRLDFAALEATPLEVAQLLRRRGVAVALRQRWADFFRNCDEVRFTPLSQATTEVLADETSRHIQAVELIQALEADPCLANSRR